MTTSAMLDEPMRIRAIMRDQSKAPIWIQVVGFLWLVSTFAIFPGDEFFLYPLSAVFFGLLFFERERILPMIARCWFLFLIPIMAVLSFIWSAYPSDTLRIGAFFILSTLSMVILGSLLTERQILRVFFLCALAGTALAITEVNAIIATQRSEYLGQKNYYAMKMMIGMITGFAVAMNRHENLILRMLGFAVIPINLALILAASSATSMVLSFLALFLLISAQLFWVNSRSVKGLRTFIAGLGIVLAIAGALLALGAVNSSVVGEALAALGKDSTFTGRTALWEQAGRTSAEHPVLGVAVGGFWQYDVGAAQTLVINDNRDPGTVLGFHNSYLEAQVHLGWVGLGLFVFMIAMCLWKAAQSFVVEATFERTCYFVAAIILVSITFTESFLFGFLQPAIYMFQLAAITAIASNMRKRTVYLRVKPEADDQLAPAPA
ncbi:MAG: O-antigen ligase family protein [Pseudomonadota bacterium]